MKTNYVWTIRVNRVVIQFASKELAFNWQRPEGFPPGKGYLFLAPRNTAHDFIVA